MSYSFLNTVMIKTLSRCGKSALSFLPLALTLILTVGLLVIGNPFGQFTSLASAQEKVTDRPALLVLYGPGARSVEGDPDNKQVINLRVPASHDGPVYVRVFDADISLKHDLFFGAWGDTSMVYSVFAGTTARMLGTVEIGNDQQYDGKWESLFKLDPAQGILEGSGSNSTRFFRLEVKGTIGNDANIYDVELSASSSTAVAIEGASLQATGITVRIPDGPKSAKAKSVQMLLDIPQGTSAIEVENFDAAGANIELTGPFASKLIEPSNQGDWARQTVEFNLAERTLVDRGENAAKGRFALTLSGGEESPNDLTVLANDQDDKRIPFDLPVHLVTPVGPRPVASFTTTTSSCQEIEFQAAPHLNQNGSPLDISWRINGADFSGPNVRYKYDNPGMQYVRLEVRDGSQAPGDGVELTKAIYVKTPPMAGLMAPSLVAVGASATFDASKSVADAKFPTTSYTFDFGDGTTSISASPIANHSYQTPGEYNVTLTTDDGSGEACATASAQAIVKVNAPPVANISPADLFLAVNQTTSFDGLGSSDAEGIIASHSWDFGDGNTAKGGVVGHHWKSPGLYKVVLAVDDGSGLKNSGHKTSIDVRVNAAPVPDIAAPASAHTGEIVTFDASASADSDGSILAYNWTFGDGTDVGGAAQSSHDIGPDVVHSWRQPGTYTIQLEVEDASGWPGRFAAISRQIEITHGPNLSPVADAGPDHQTEIGQIVAFNGSASHDLDGTILGYEWDFGDGSTAKTAEANHSWHAPGEYKVSLTVTDDGVPARATSVDVAIVKISHGVNTSPTANPGPDRSAKVGEAISFDASGSTDPDGNIVKFNWDFGNGDSASGRQVTYAYPLAGNYTGRLTVEDASGLPGAVADQTFAVVIEDFKNAQPTAIVQANSKAAIGEPITFDAKLSNDPDGTVIGFEWDFKDSGTGSGPVIAHAFAQSGIYDVVLAATDDGVPNPNTSTVVHRIVVNEPPIAKAGPDQHLTASLVQFDGRGSFDPDGEIGTYKWDFGDGSTGEGTAPTHVYRAPGEYVVGLVVADRSGTIRNQADDDMKVRINAIPIADAGPEVIAAPGERINFDGSGSIDPDGDVARYEWSMGDGTKITGQSVDHKYKSPGTYFVVLSVFDDTGHDAAVDHSETTVIINQPPVADAGAPILTAPGDEVTLSAAQSYDPDGEIVEYRWDFSDGDDVLDGETVTRIFAEPGVHRAQVTVIDDNEVLNSEVTADVEVHVNHTPVAVAGPDVSGDKLTVVFDGSQSLDADGDPLSFSWDFGDGNTGTGIRISHTYAEGGSYPVILTVNDGTELKNAVHRNALTVEINRSPLAVAGENRPVCTGDTVVFDGSQSLDPEGGVLRYLWDFGDGTSAPVVNPTKVYAEAGAYPVTLMVRDDSGLTNDTHTDRITVRVNSSPIARAGPDIKACANTEVAFDGSASWDHDGVVNAFEWDFGDGGYGGGEFPRHIYRSPGNFEVRLSIEGEAVGQCDTRSSDRVAVQILPAPEARIVAPKTSASGVEVAFDGSLSSFEGGKITSWDWDFGDGNTGTGAKALHTFKEPGDYKVTLSVASDAAEDICRVISSNVEITVNNQPVAEIKGDRQITVGLESQFSGAASRDKDGGIISYVWDFGDGTTGQGVNVGHVYEDAGEYELTLTVRDETDTKNNEGSQTIKVSVKEPAPPSFTHLPQAACPAVPVVFSTDGNGAKKLDWAFGDGSHAAGTSAAHSYARAGTYSVTLMRTEVDAAGTSLRANTEALIVNAPPVAKAGRNRRICPNVAEVFDASASFDPDGKLSRMLWDFGDGTTAEGARIEHKFSKPGTYSVRLRVEDHSGSVCASNEDTIEVVVNAPPVANAGADIDAFVGGANDEVRLDGSASFDPDGASLQHIWELSNGEVHAGRKARYRLDTPGSIEATLTVDDMSGLSCGRAQDVVTINAKPRS